MPLDDDATVSSLNLRPQTLVTVTSKRPAAAAASNDDVPMTPLTPTSSSIATGATASSSASFVSDNVSIVDTNETITSVVSTPWLLSSDSADAAADDDDDGSLAKARALLFGSDGQCSDLDVQRWHAQGFAFADTSDCTFGLTQAYGGPCGVLAPVQAFVLKELLFGDHAVATWPLTSPSSSSSSSLSSSSSSSSSSSPSSSSSVSMAVAEAEAPPLSVMSAVLSPEVPLAPTPLQRQGALTRALAHIFVLFVLIISYTLLFILHNTISSLTTQTINE
jgi:hypothetical protein